MNSYRKKTYQYLYVMTKSSVIHQQSKMSNIEIIEKIIMKKLNAQIK